MSEDWKIDGKKLCEFVNQKIDHHENMIAMGGGRGTSGTAHHVGASGAYRWIVHEFHLQTLFSGDDPYICRCEACQNSRTTNRDKLSRVDEKVNTDWLEIKTIRPDYDVYVLISNGKEIAIGKLFPGGYFQLLGGHTDYHIDDPVFKITHWMPLPNLPID